MAESNLIITKAEAARRQLETAIDLFFRQEDELSIHTLAFAGYRLVYDMSRGRGDHPFDDISARSVRSLIKDISEGKLPKEQVSQELLNQIQPILDAYQADELDLNDVEFVGSLDDSQSFHKHLNQSANFLKHADRDSAGMLELEQVDNRSLLLQAMGIYERVMTSLTPRMVLLFHFLIAEEQSEDPSAIERYEPDPDIEALRELEPADRFRICAEISSNLKS